MAVVGAGFCGAAAAIHLLRRDRGVPHVTLIERGERFGPGLAYGAAAGANLLNVRAAQISALAEEPDHFERWLERRVGGVQSARFVARRLFGLYLEETLRAAAARRWPSRLKRVRGAAVACRRDGEGWAVTLATGRVIAADDVVLALGHPPTATPPPLAPEDVIGAWDHAAQERLPRAGDVLLLGTGLTMVDVALALAESPRKGVMYALSRRGRLPLAHAAGAAAQAPAPDLPPTLSGALHAVRASAADAADWRVVVNALRPQTPALWAGLAPEAQRRFLRHLRPWWDSHRHRTAPEIAARIAALIAEGRLRILSGEIAHAAREGAVWRLQHRGRGSAVRHRMEVVGVINCTGADYDLRRWDDPLVRQLLDEGLARAPANGLGFDIDPDNRLRDTAGAAQPGLFALGPLALGSFWETLAVPELRARAAAIARALD